MPKTNLLDIVDVLETYADLYDIFDDNKFVCKELDKVNEELRAIPYVKAIPVEWIKNYARHKASKGFTEIDCYWQFWEDDVLKMVADWEKENGKDN